MNLILPPLFFQFNLRHFVTFIYLLIINIYIYDVFVKQSALYTYLNDFYWTLITFMIRIYDTKNNVLHKNCSQYFIYVLRKKFKWSGFLLLYVFVSPILICWKSQVKIIFCIFKIFSFYFFLFIIDAILYLLKSERNVKLFFTCIIIFYFFF